MKLAHAACALIPLLAGGCVIKSDPPEVTLAALGTIPEGTWLIDEAVATDPAPPGAKPPLGLQLSFGLMGAGDAGGRRCINPKYQAGDAPLADVIGGRGEAMNKTVAAIAIECNGRPFAVYATMAEGVMLTRHGPWVLRLTRIDPPAPSLVVRQSEPEQTASAPRQPEPPKVKLHPAWQPDEQPAPSAAAPVANPEPQPPSPPEPQASQPEPPPPASVAKAEPPPPQPVPALAIDLTTFLTAPAAAQPPTPAEPPPAEAQPEATSTRLVYLASYSSEERARIGWKTLSQRATVLGRREPVLRSVVLPDKGRFVRLFTTARDEGDARRVCAELSQALADCGAPDRE